MSSDVVGTRSWQFVSRSMAAAEHSPEVSNATVFVFGKEVLTVLADSEGSGVFPRSRDAELLLIILL